MKRILISGGTGLIGLKLTSYLEGRGYEVAWLSRRVQSRKSFLWNVEKGQIDKQSVEWADAIIHLAGAGVADGRWTAERKRMILESRTKSTSLLYQAIAEAQKKPDTFVSASAIGFYGFNTGTNLLTEDFPQGTDFLADVVQRWENEVLKMNSLQLRTVLLRIGIVLDAAGGALPEILKAPIAAPLGSGDQWMSWIHVDDLVRMFVFALEKTTLQGIFNAVGPSPATNQALTKAAAKTIGKTYMGIGVPALVLKMLLGEMSEMVLGGNRVSSNKIQKAGFSFNFPKLSDALANIYP